MKSSQIRSSFIDFFKDKGHKFVPSSPLIPLGDKSLLFANAGMNQFKDIFLGLAGSDCSRAVNSQKCLRVSGKHNDLEEVGKDTYHHTFFEMLGNWSFDDYFKAEAIQWAWQLLTEVWKINPDCLWATFFEGDKANGLPRDDQAAELWAKLTKIPAERILPFGRKDNFWEMGSVGPCGPCSEIHIDLGAGSCDKQNDPNHKCEVNSGCSRFVELWNLVFIQYNRTEDNQFVPLKAKYIDTGAGLERIAAVLQNKKSNYDTDLFSPIISRLSEMSGHKYTSELNNKTDNAFRVIADHIRTLVFAITDGAVPSNEGRGYVIRRILRRAARFGRELGLKEPFLYKLSSTVVDVMGEAFGEIKEKSNYVSSVIESEEVGFGRTLEKGIALFVAAAERAEKRATGNGAQGTISGQDAFQLYDTYGFPLDLTELMAKEKQLKVDTKKFEELMAEQKNRARSAQKNSSIENLLGSVSLEITDDLQKYETDICQTSVTNIIDTSNKPDLVVDKISLDSKDGELGLVLKKTCFYAESGGQVGDCGIIKSSSGEFAVETTEKFGESVIHWGKVVCGSIAAGQKVTASVDKNRRESQKNHTATHLLQWALQEVIGKSIAQQGSMVCPDYLRFDFTCPKALTAEEIKKVENLVREKIAEDLPITSSTLAKSEAEKLGAMALFGEKYGDEVRVVVIGVGDKSQISEAFSKEFCGGIHIDRTGAIGDFKIIKEESVSAGVRRITGLTGSALSDYFTKQSEIIAQLSQTLKVPAELLPERIEKLLNDLKAEKKRAKSSSGNTQDETMLEAKSALEKCEVVGKTSIVTIHLSAASIEQARTAIDMLKKKAESAAIVLGFSEDEKVTLISAVTDDLIKAGLKAGDIIKQIAPIVDGRGGGRPQMAQAGGKEPEKIDDALIEAAKIIKEKLVN